jgi:NAD(P)-dependent dehydrogenase (short-subunit alcohol dehydrogenase family)
MAGMVNARRFAPYPASKFAVVGMSEGLANGLEAFGIGVTVVCPGFVRTRIMESARNRHERYGLDPVSNVVSPVAARVAEFVPAWNQNLGKGRGACLGWADPKGMVTDRRYRYGDPKHRLEISLGGYR